MSHYGLENHGIKHAGDVHWNLPVSRLVEEAVKRGEGILINNGALNAMTGKRTGRSPKDKFIVEEPTTKSQIWWGKVNQPMAEADFLALRSEVLAHMQGRELFVMDGFAGADERYQMPIRIVTELAYHNLFVKQLFRKATPAQLAKMVPEWTVINACKYLADAKRYRLNSEAFIVMHFPSKTVIIGGTEYAGEMKKSIFSVLNYVLPQKGVFPMHCSANVGKDGDVALFFGLSGTGKTTLSADPDRGLIGDDEHGWSDRGIFNFEGGCYAKCIKLTKEREPQIWDAIRFGAVIENVVVNKETREPDYFDDSITENTRCAYPLEFISNAVPSGVGGHPKAIVFLAADAFGVLPAVARLTPAQAMYHFMSGYTASLAGTEANAGRDPVPTFSTCFGAPFLPLPPQVYAELLAKKMKEHKVPCYLLNSGWVGNAFGQGPRIPLAINRLNITQILTGVLDKAQFYKDPIFGFEVPKSLPGVPSELLEPRRAAKDPADYNARARDLAGKFIKNFEQYHGVSAEILGAGPKLA
jgi:phosphoenolpyruvate carboxykinase (ATP)